MDAILEESLLMGGHNATLSLRLARAHSKFRANCLVYQDGGAFVVTPELIGFLRSQNTDEYAQHIVLLDRRNSPKIVEVKPTLEKFQNVYRAASEAYLAEHTRLVKSTTRRSA